jgi:hypothetical protein
LAIAPVPAATVDTRIRSLTPESVTTRPYSAQSGRASGEWVELDAFFQGASLRIADVPVRGQPGPQGQVTARSLLIGWKVRQQANASIGDTMNY